MAGVALAGFFLAGQFGLARQVGWLVAVPLAAASYLVISGTFGICIINGLQGARRADHGREAVLDAANRVQMRNRALLAVTASILIGCGFAAAFVSALG
jgi:hypothetical protein